MAKAKAKIMVQMLTSMAGESFSYAHGQRVEVPAKMAEAWIDAGLARECESEEASNARADGLEHTLKSVEAECEALRKRVAELEAELAAAKAAGNPAA